MSLILFIAISALPYPMEPAYYAYDKIPVYFYGAEQSRPQVEHAIKKSAMIVANTIKYSPSLLLDKLINSGLQIYIRKEVTGSNGSCPSKEEPERPCSGFYCPSATDSDWCDGLFTAYPFRVDYIKRACIADSALPHELIHAIMYLIGGDPISDHRYISLFPDFCVHVKKKKFKVACFLNSAERVIQQRLRTKLCE